MPPKDFQKASRNTQNLKPKKVTKKKKMKYFKLVHSALIRSRVVDAERRLRTKHNKLNVVVCSSVELANPGFVCPTLDSETGGCKLFRRAKRCLDTQGRTHNAHVLLQLTVNFSYLPIIDSFKRTTEVSNLY